MKNQKFIDFFPFTLNSSSIYGFTVKAILKVNNVQFN